MPKPIGSDGLLGWTKENINKNGEILVKHMKLAVVAVLVSACSSFSPKSAFQSGWNNDKNESAYSDCGMARIKKGMLINQNLDRLVKLGKLTNEQAERAAQVNVKPGDPECLAYAAYGLNRREISITKNADGLDIQKQVTYSCVDSDSPCPGVKVQFSDGRVIGLYPIQK